MDIEDELELNAAASEALGSAAPGGEGPDRTHTVQRISALDRAKAHIEVARAADARSDHFAAAEAYRKALSVLPEGHPIVDRVRRKLDRAVAKQQEPSKLGGPPRAAGRRKLRHSIQVAPASDLLRSDPYADGTAPSSDAPDVAAAAAPNPAAQPAAASASAAAPQPPGSPTNGRSSATSEASSSSHLRRSPRRRSQAGAPAPAAPETAMAEEKEEEGKVEERPSSSRKSRRREDSGAGGAGHAARDPVSQGDGGAAKKRARRSAPAVTAAATIAGALDREDALHSGGSGSGGGGDGGTVRRLFGGPTPQNFAQAGSASPGDTATTGHARAPASRAVSSPATHARRSSSPGSRSPSRDRSRSRSRSPTRARSRSPGPQGTVSQGDARGRRRSHSLAADPSAGRPAGAGGKTSPPARGGHGSEVAALHSLLMDDLHAPVAVTGGPWLWAAAADRMDAATRVTQGRLGRGAVGEAAARQLAPVLAALRECAPPAYARQPTEEESVEESVPWVAPVPVTAMLGLAVPHHALSECVLPPVLGAALCALRVDASDPEARGAYFVSVSLCGGLVLAEHAMLPLPMEDDEVGEDVEVRSARLRESRRRRLRFRTHDIRSLPHRPMDGVIDSQRPAERALRAVVQVMACAAAVREQAVPTRGMATTRRSSTGTFSEATSPAARALLTQQHRAAGVGVGGTSLFRSPTLLAAETSPAPLSYGAGHGAAASGAAAGAAGKRKARSPFVAGSPGPLRSMARAPAMVAALAHALRLIAEDGMLVVPADAVKRGLSTAAPEEHPLATVFEAEERAVELGTVDEEKVPCGPEEGEESEGDDPLGDPATWRSPEFVTLPPVGSAEQQRHMKAAKQLRGALSSLPRAMKGGAGGKSPASSSDVGHRAGVRVTFDSAARAAARTYAAQLESVLVPGQPLPLHEQGEDLLSSLLRYYSRLAFNPVRQSVYFNAHDTREVYRKAWRDPELREVLLSNGIDLTEEMGTAVEGEGDDGQMQGQAGGVDAAAAPASPPAARSGLDEGALDAAAVDDVADEDFELDGEAESPQPQALRNLNERWRREHQEELRAADAESPCTPRGRRVCRAPGDVVPARAGSPAASPRPGHRQARTQPLVGAQAGPSAAAARFQPAGAAAAAGEKKEEEGENEEDVWVQLVTIQGREAPGNIGNMLGVGGDADLAFNAEDVSALLHHALLQRARLLRLLDAGKDGLVLAAPSHGRGLRRTWAAKLRAAATVLAQKAEAARAQGQGPRLPRADRPCEGLWSALQDALDAVPCAVEDELVAARALAEEEGATGDPSDGMDNAKEELALSGDEGASPSLVEGDRGGGAGYDTESFRAEEVEAWAAECRVGFRTAHRFMSQLFSTNCARTALAAGHECWHRLQLYAGIVHRFACHQEEEFAPLRDIMRLCAHLAFENNFVHCMERVEGLFEQRQSERAARERQSSGRRRSRLSLNGGPPSVAGKQPRRRKLPPPPPRGVSVHGAVMFDRCIDLPSLVELETEEDGFMGEPMPADAGLSAEGGDAEQR